MYIKLTIADNGKEILSMNEVLSYLLKSSMPLVRSEDLRDIAAMSQGEWMDYVDEVRGMIVTMPGMVSLSLVIFILKVFWLALDFLMLKNDWSSWHRINNENDVMNSFVM